GEAIGYNKTLEKALYKGVIASGIDIPHEGSGLLTLAYKDKVEANYVGELFHNLGFDLFATSCTANFSREKGLPDTELAKTDTEELYVLSVIKNGKVQFVINTLTSGTKPRSDGFKIRREAVEHATISLTNLDTAHAILNVIDLTTF